MRAATRPASCPCSSARALCARYAGATAWLASERDWRPEDARRLAAVAEEVARLGRTRRDAAERCQWHADRLRELVRQHAVLVGLEAKHLPCPAWPVARDRLRAGARRKALASRSLRA